MENLNNLLGYVRDLAFNVDEVRYGIDNLKTDFKSYEESLENMYKLLLSCYRDAGYITIREYLSKSGMELGTYDILILANNIKEILKKTNEEEVVIELEDKPTYYLFKESIIKEAITACGFDK